MSARSTAVEKTVHVARLAAAAREGDARAVARLISLVENGDPALPEVAAALAPYTGKAQIIGLTGSPGVGKSTTTNELVRALPGRGPPGRACWRSTRPARSPAGRSSATGCACRTTPPTPGSTSARCPAAGTWAGWPRPPRRRCGCWRAPAATWCWSRRSGWGRPRWRWPRLADTTVVLLAPGMGDAIQAVKAGILEIADVFVVNKADRDGADATYHDIQGMIALGERGPGQWRPQVVRAVAVRAEGIDDMVAAIAKHRAWLVEHGELRARRERRAAVEVEEIALGTLRARLGTLRAGTALPALAADVAAGRLDPFAAAARLVAGLDSAGLDSDGAALGDAAGGEAT